MSDEKQQPAQVPKPIPMAVTPNAPSNMTVREAVARLVMSEDMDAELCLSIHNSDPIPVTDITDSGDGQVTVS